MTSVALQATSARIRTIPLLPALVAVAAALVAWWAGDPYVVGVFHDDGVYALLAKSIATGGGFHHIGLPGSPVATHYPPLYPLLLAAAWWAGPTFPDNLDVLLGLNAALVGAAAFGILRFARSSLGWSAEGAALAAVATSIVSPVLALSSMLLSESLFLALLWPVLVATESAAEGSDARGPVLAGAAVGALMLVRTHAIALGIALLLVLIWRRRGRDALVALGAALLVQLPWLAWVAHSTHDLAAPLEGSYGSYAAWFVAGLRAGGPGFLAATVQTNLRECWLLVQDRVMPGTATALYASTAGLLIGFMAWGGWRTSKRAPVTMLFTVLYLAIVLIWPYTPWRFLWTMWPLLLLLAAEGVRTLWTSATPRLLRVTGALAAGMVTLAMVRTEAAAYAERSWNLPARRAGGEIIPLVRWVGRHTRSTDVVLAEGEPVISLFTGRRAAPTTAFTAREYLVARDSAESLAALRVMLGAVPARYVLPLAPSVERAARSLSEQRSGLREIARLPGSTVFEVTP